MTDIVGFVGFVGFVRFDRFVGFRGQREVNAVLNLTNPTNQANPTNRNKAGSFRVFSPMRSLFPDIRYPFRLLIRHRGFTAVAALVLALGIGASITVFAITDALLLKPIAGRADSPIVGVYTRDKTQPDSYRAFSYPEYEDLR